METKTIKLNEIIFGIRKDGTPIYYNSPDLLSNKESLKTFSQIIKTNTKEVIKYGTRMEP